MNIKGKHKSLTSKVSREARAKAFEGAIRNAFNEVGGLRAASAIQHVDCATKNAIIKELRSPDVPPLSLFTEVQLVHPTQGRKNIMKAPHDAEHLFHGFRYDKTSAEIKAAVEKKTQALQEKIAERQERVAKLRQEHEIDDAALIQLLTAARTQQHKQQYSYSTSNARTGRGMEERTIGAGAVNHLLTETDFIESEKETLKRLGFVTRNLRPVHYTATESGTAYTYDYFTLSYDEMEFLGF